ncbi:MAG: hypothetical protein L3J96_05140 [Thermoplasmata archaeon]|nr:hypothetical protein [Thermoplasmata archaeon]
MRRALFLAAIVVVVIGLAVVAYTQLTVVTIPIPQDPSAEIVSGFTIVGSAKASVHWSGGISSTVVQLYRCTDAACADPGTPIINGSGASGSVTFPIAAGTSYEINTTGGPPVNGSLTISGLTNLGVIGLILVASGVVLVAWSFRRPLPPRSEEREPFIEPE